MKSLLCRLLNGIAVFGKRPPETREPNVKISLVKNHWSFIAETGSTELLNTVGGALDFSFPSCQISWRAPKLPPINYLETMYSTSILAYASIAMTLRLTTTGTPVFNYMTESFNTWVYPAQARFIIDTEEMVSTTAGGQTLMLSC